MSKFLNGASLGVTAVGLSAGNAWAAQGPGVGAGGATVTDEISVAIGAVAALLIAVILARRDRG